MTTEAEKLEQEAEDIITHGIMGLPEGRESGTAKQLVRALVDASLARLKQEIEKVRAASKKGK